MPSTREIVDNVKLLLDNRVSIDDFGDWMLVYTAKIMQDGADDTTRQLAYAIQDRMTTFDTDHLDESALRLELAKAIKPFSSPTA